MRSLESDVDVGCLRHFVGPRGVHFPTIRRAHRVAIGGGVQKGFKKVRIRTNSISQKRPIGRVGPESGGVWVSGGGCFHGVFGLVMAREVSIEATVVPSRWTQLMGRCGTCRHDMETHDLSQAESDLRRGNMFPCWNNMLHHASGLN